MMFNLFKYKLRRFFDWLDMLKGSRTLKYITTYRPSDSNYRIITNNEFEITIFCCEHVYKCSYSKPWVRDKIISVFQVYAVCSDATPPALKDKLLTDLKISAIVSMWSTREYHKKVAIQAYVDLIIHDLYEYKCTH